MNKTNASFVTDWPLLGVMGHARARERKGNRRLFHFFCYPAVGLIAFFYESLFAF